MEEISRTRPAVCAEGEEDEGEEDGTPANTSTVEIVVLDSDGELDNNEEALVLSNKQENGLEVKLESNGRKNGPSIAVEEEEEIRAALSELEDMIAQFFPEEAEGNTDRTAAAVISAATAATTNTSAAVAVAIALVCSRCLHAHLGTPAITEGSPISSSLSVVSGGAAPRVVGGSHRDDEGGEGEEFLRLLKERCGVSDALKARPAGGMTMLEKTKQKEEISIRERQRQQQDGERSVMPECLSEIHPTESEVSSKDLSLLTAKGVRSEAKLVSEIATHGGLTGSKTEGEEGIQTAGGGTRDSDEDDMPEFLLQLEAGWVLASAVWEGVTLLEKVRDYERAVELLTHLLATRQV